LIGSLDVWGLSVPLPVALAAVATIGYVMGRRKYASENGLTPRSRRELRRARCIARDLERIARTVRKNISRHHASVVKFKQRVGILSEQEQAAAWKTLCQEAEAMLTPTLQLANQIATAYDQIRQQSNNLMTFTEIRTDPLTGVANRRGLETTLETQFALMNRFGNAFSAVIFDVDRFKRINDEQGHLEGDRLLRHVASLIDTSVRDTDIIARYGGEEFVVVLPQTDLDGACDFAERLRRELGDETPLTVSAGVTTALDGDNIESLLARLDAALYAAKSAGRNCVFRHDGQVVEAPAEGVLV
jgi:diguanylate cyclase (GGDEF)-like protein